jgi:hypothetical protein
MQAATLMLHEKSVSDKNELLFQHGINFNNMPLWQRRGIGLHWEEYEKIGFDPVRHEEVKALRRRLKVERGLPVKDEYGRFVGQLEFHPSLRFTGVAINLNFERGKIRTWHHQRLMKMKAY